MTKNLPAFTNVSNPAAFGVEWTADSGSRYTMVNIRGTYGLTFGVRLTAEDPWITTRVDGAERFGLTEPPATYRAFLAIVTSFVLA